MLRADQLHRELSSLRLKSLTTAVHLFHIKTGASGFPWGGWVGSCVPPAGRPPLLEPPVRAQVLSSEGKTPGDSGQQVALRSLRT